MKAIKTEIPGVVLLEPEVFGDARGYFMERFSQRRFDELVGPVRFVQDNESKSRYGVVRGLHFQKGEYAQAKLVSCLHGSIFNVAVDLRPGETFGHAYSAVLSFENRKQMYIPRGFAHGYLTLKDDTLMQWCVDNDFCGEAAKAVRYDSDFVWEGEPWPAGEYIVSEKDRKAIYLSDILVKEN